jgi:phosphatidylethanolamine-binding protein (PEBP) family uncharacterized protein
MNPLIRFKRISLPLLIATALMCVFASLTLWAQQHQSVDNNGGNGRKEFSVSSSTFTNGGTLPLITVWNQCSNYPGGNDESPELSWTNVPRRTESFVVVAYDVTASFTHWGTYNISGSSTGLPLNAGIPNSPYGTQVANDFGDLSYDRALSAPAIHASEPHLCFHRLRARYRAANAADVWGFPSGIRGALSRADYCAGRQAHSKERQYRRPFPAA